MSDLPAALPQVSSQPRASRVVSLIVLHCSATPPGRHVTVYDIDSWHFARGFKRKSAAVEKFNPLLRSIGYHYVIDLLGQLHTGRAEEEIGAHVSGSNANSVAACMVGTSRYTRDQWQTMAALVRALRLRYPGARVVGHRDLSPDLNGDGIVQPQEWLKTCPGFDVRHWLRGGLAPLQPHLVPD